METRIRTSPAFTLPLLPHALNPSRIASAPTNPSIRPRPYPYSHPLLFFFPSPFRLFLASFVFFFYPPVFAGREETRNCTMLLLKFLNETVITFLHDITHNTSPYDLHVVGSSGEHEKEGRKVVGSDPTCSYATPLTMALHACTYTNTWAFATSRHRRFLVTRLC